jgi:hypothetical protein
VNGNRRGRGYRGESKEEKKERDNIVVGLHLVEEVQRNAIRDDLAMSTWACGWRDVVMSKTCVVVSSSRTKVLLYNCQTSRLMN